MKLKLCLKSLHRFGRRPIIQVSFVASTIFGTLEAFSTSYVMFAITRTLCGVALTGMIFTTVSLCKLYIYSYCHY